MQHAKFIVLISIVGLAVLACGKQAAEAPQALASQTLAAESSTKKEQLKAGALAACKTDQETLCPGLKFGEGLVKCARAHKNELSESCLSFVREHAAELKAWRKQR